MKFLPIIKFEFDSYCLIYTYILLALVNDMSGPPKESCTPTYLTYLPTVPQVGIEIHTCKPSTPTSYTT